MAKSRYSFLALALVAVCPLCAVGQQSRAGVAMPGNAATQVAEPRMDYLANVQKHIESYLDGISNVHCTERVTQEKLSKEGRVEVKRKSEFDYLIMMTGSGDDFEINESRREIGAEKHKTEQSMLISNGISTALLVFHPYYRDAFEFRLGQPQTLAGRAALPIQFQHIPGRRTPLALALRSREFPIDMSGTAWVDPSSGAVLRIEAHLERDMSDIGLRSLDIAVDYAPVHVAQLGSTANFPVLAVVEVSTPKQRWRNTHAFAEYRSFSTEAVQGSSVTVKKESPAEPNVSADPHPAQAPSNLPIPKEKQ